MAEARERDLSDSFVLSGTSAKFSITFDLAWKVMKDILVQYYAITGFVTGSPREVLKQSFQAKLITGDEWIDMLKIRNQLAHDYDGVIVKEHCQTIIHLYIDKLYDFKTVVELELTWLRDWEKDHYDLGDNEIHLAFTTDDMEASHKKHEEMGCICFENPAMGIYFITDPDGYWLEIVPEKM